MKDTKHGLFPELHSLTALKLKILEYVDRNIWRTEISFFFLSKIGVVTFLKSFSKAKTIHMNDGN